MKQLRYIGKSFLRRVNGRPLRNGDVITDKREVRDLEPLPDFEVVYEGGEDVELSDMDEG